MKGTEPSPTRRGRVIDRAGTRYTTRSTLHRTTVGKGLPSLIELMY
jgi:hypothetical protein